MKKNGTTLPAMLMMFGLLYLAAATAAHTQAAADPAAIARAPRVGFIDMDAITAKAVFAQDLKKKVEEEYDAKRSHFQVKQAEYASLLDDIKTTEAGLTEEAKDAKYKKAFQLKAALDEEQYNLDKFLKDSDKKKAPALDRIVAAAKEVAQQEGYDVVLAHELLVYGRDTVDLSDKVVTKLNTQAEASAPAPAAKSEKKPQGSDAK